MTGLAPLVDQLPRATLVVGKGGVGKTTCAALIAATFAERGERTLLLSTDPAAALGAALGAAVTTSASPVSGRPTLFARQLSAAELRRDFLEQWRDTIAEIVDRGTYLDREDVDGLVDAALPGSDEIFAVLALADHLGEPAYARIVVDTAPTGHTLRLLELPETFRALVSMLDLMQGKHRFMVRALTHRYRSDRADAFLGDMRTRVEALRAALVDGSTLAAVVVTRDEPVVAAETRRLVDRLREMRIRVAAIVRNAATRADAPIDLGVDAPTFAIPRAAVPPRDLASIVRVLGAARSPAVVPPRTRSGRRAPNASLAPVEHMLRPVTIVGGKGGVGKSTVASALAIIAADAGRAPVLLVSTDPAPSLADALGAADAPWARADVEADVADVAGLVVRQMDATAAFARLREAYQSRVDGLFDALVSRGIDVEHDRGILRELLALAPPGVDEVFALSALGDALAERRYETIVVDPAPTGHLLRLLEMPAIALDWSHRLMRLMLKYRDVVGLGDTARDLLDFSRRTRELDALLHDRERCSVVIATLDEPVVRGEAERLAAAVVARGIDVGAIVWNRATGSPVPLPVAVPARQFCADEVEPPPIGVRALRSWARSWQTLDSNS
ncbi:MAG: ArsA family ATPase [Gemmatimonadaceae bacterium]